MKINHLPFLSLSFCLAVGSLTVRAQTGIGTTTPTSTLQVVGSLAGNYATVTATTYALGISDYYVSFGAGATAASTFTLPMAALAKGRIYYLKNDNTTYAVTVSPNGSETINGSATVTVPTGQTIQLVSTGSASGATWEVVGFANSTAAAPTFSNGLTKTGPNTVLGGPLTQATNIPLGSNSLTLSTGTVGTGVLVFDGQGIAGSTTNTAKQRIEFTSNGDPNAVIGHTVAAGTVENNDLYLYTGNDANGSFGADRIRLVGENLLFQSFNNAATSTVANAESNTGTITNMFIGSDGKVGIGTSTPTTNLDVLGSVRLEALSVAGGVVSTDANGNLSSVAATTINPTTASNGLTKTGANTVLGGALIQATNIPLGNNSLTFSTGTTGTGVLVFDGQGIAGSTTNTAKQRIEFTSNGDPNAVIGHTIAAGTNETNDLFLYAGNDANATNNSYGPDRIRLVGENILFQSFNNVNTSTVANAESNTSTVTNMLIGSDGKVGIGTITPAASLDVNGVAIVRNGLQVTSATGPLVSLTTTTAAVSSVPAFNNVVYDVAGDENHIFGGNVVSYTDNKYSLGLSQSRWTAVYAVNGTIQTSDRRLKTNILNSAYGLGAVMKMRPVTYNWKTSPTSNPMVGFIAQEMESIVPEAVDVPKTAAEHYGMKYNELIPVLTKAIQEQQAQIELLTAANAGLKAELKAELAGKASASILTELQAALQSLRAEVQGLQAASQTASSSIPR